MPRLTWMPRLLAGTALCVSAGCYSMPPYGQQPYGSRPGMYGPAPGQPVFTTPTLTVPPSSYVAPGESIAPPSMAQPAAVPTAPAADSPASEGSSVVPKPRDPAGAKAVPAGQTSQVGRGTFSLPASAQAELEAAEHSAPTPVRTAQTQPRVGQKPLDRGEQHVVAVSHQDSSVFDHDGKHQWFQGVVEYDADEKTWHLLYDPRPKETDQLGGDITLSGRIPFTAQDEQKVFRVFGEFDRNQLDRLGEPVYQVSHADEFTTH